MKKVKLFVVVDAEDGHQPRALWAGTSEESANDFADIRWAATRFDALVSEVWAYIEEED